VLATAYEKHRQKHTSLNKCLNVTVVSNQSIKCLGEMGNLTFSHTYIFTNAMQYSVGVAIRGFYLLTCLTQTNGPLS